MNISISLCLIILSGLELVLSMRAVSFSSIQQRLHGRREHSHRPPAAPYRYGAKFGNGNDNGNCFGNCHENNSGNRNGNNNGGTANGNVNGNCQGNCVGNENGNANGNYNRYSHNNGNNNGNCFGNCYHNSIGNGNGNRNHGTNNNGNNVGNCRGNCFHNRYINNKGNENYQRYKTYQNQKSPSAHSSRGISCVGNCFPEKQPINYFLKPTPYHEITKTPLTCNASSGYTYYVTPESYCVEIHRRKTHTNYGAHKTHCARGEAFDLDICACNSWFLVSVRDSCRSGTGKFKSH